jgi:hypothetical protein
MFMVSGQFAGRTADGLELTAAVGDVVGCSDFTTAMAADNHHF